MNNLEFNKLLDKVILPEIIKTRQSGGQEYARSDENIFANFERVSNTLDITPEEVIMTYTLKHIDGIVAHIKGHVSQREDVRGRITDAAVYLFLLWAYLVKDDSENTDVDESTNSTPGETEFEATQMTGYTLGPDGTKIEVPLEISPLGRPNMSAREEEILKRAEPERQAFIKRMKSGGGCCGGNKKSQKEEDK